MDLSFEQACAREAVELHEFFRDWLTGALPRTADAFERFRAAMGDGLMVISPRGTVSARDDILSEFEALHGQLAEKADRFEIAVENFRCLRDLGDTFLCSYEEWHRLDGEASARLTTVLYGRNPDAPLGVEWLHVHETWLPGQAPTAGERFPEPE